MKGYRKVLIAVNGSKKVLSEGLKLAGDEKSWVTVVKVLPEMDGDLNLTGIKNIEDVLGGGERSEPAEIRKIADEERMLIRTRIERGDAHKAIVGVAEEENCDLIIVGSKKRGFMRRIFGDNTVEKVVNSSPCPVLVVGA